MKMATETAHKAVREFRQLLSYQVPRTLVNYDHARGVEGGEYADSCEQKLKGHIKRQGYEDIAVERGDDAVYLVALDD